MDTNTAATIIMLGFFALVGFIAWCTLPRG